MSAEEIHYYENRCNGCEGEWHDAITHWRHGGRNDYFDKYFSFDAEPKADSEKG